MIQEKLQENRTKKTADSSRGDANSRGDGMLELVRQTSVQNLEMFKYNDMTDFDIQADPAVVWEEINNFNCEYFDSQLTLDCNLEK